MKYTVLMGSDVMIYIPSFIKLVQAFKFKNGKLKGHRNSMYIT
jgi:hypothetical protein